MRGDVTFSYVRTDEMLADMMTKAVPTGKHLACCRVSESDPSEDTTHASVVNKAYSLHVV
jgi:hypothetical protein